jgi:hypothetical protein
MTAAPAASLRIPSGNCPTHALPLSARDLPSATAATLRFVAGPWARANPEMDVRGASGRAGLAPRNVRGGYARIKCGRTVWRRTAVVFVRLPRMGWSASLSSPVFYASRTSRGWLVWFQIH